MLNRLNKYLGGKKMGYILNEEQNSLVDMVEKFMTNEVKPHVAEFDITGEFPKELYKKAFELGLHCIDIPEEFGGGGVDYLTAAAIYEEIGKVDAGFATGLCATSLALKPVLIAGTPEQKKLFSDIIIPGAFGAFCLTEPDAGSDAGSIRTTAVRDGDEYIINGGKCFITNGGVSDVFVVFASTDKSKGLKGLTAFIVERSRAGITVGKEENKMGIRLSNTSEVIFEDVRIPVTNLLGKEGDGFKIAMKTLDLSRPFVGVIAVGIAQRAIDESIKYSTEIKIDPITNTLIRAGVPSIVNPFDAYALDLAVRIKETNGGLITVLSMGPEQAKAALKECLSVGADKAILVSDRAFGGSDTLATSYILSTTIKAIENKTEKFDLILCGKQAIDGDTGQVGPEIAEHLGYAQVTYAEDITVDGKIVRVTRENDDRHEIIETQIPAVITVIKTAYEPKYATIRSKMAANRVQIPTMTSGDLDIDLERAGLKGSPTKVKKTFTPQLKKSGIIIKGETGSESALKLISLLSDARLI